MRLSIYLNVGNCFIQLYKCIKQSSTKIFPKFVNMNLPITPKSQRTALFRSSWFRRKILPTFNDEELQKNCTKDDGTAER